MSSKEWRILHGLSHHLYANTLWDFEIYALEPFATYLPQPDNLFFRLFSVLFQMPLYLTVFFGVALKRYYSLYAEWRKAEYRDVVPFCLPFFMSFFAPSFFEAIKLWLGIISMSSFFFLLIALNSAHHHPEIFHDGDIVRKDLDLALIVLDVVRDRKVIDDSLFFSLTSFGSDGMHHLLPTVDHDYLPLCLPVFHETCREFGVDVDNSQHILRTLPKANYRIGPQGGPLHTCLF